MTSKTLATINKKLAPEFDCDHNVGTTKRWHLAICCELRKCWHHNYENVGTRVVRMLAPKEFASDVFKPKFTELYRKHAKLQLFNLVYTLVTKFTENKAGLRLLLLDLWKSWQRTNLGKCWHHTFSRLDPRKHLRLENYRPSVGNCRYVAIYVSQPMFDSWFICQIHGYEIHLSSLKLEVLEVKSDQISQSEEMTTNDGRSSLL